MAHPPRHVFIWAALSSILIATSASPPAPWVHSSQFRQQWNRWPVLVNPFLSRHLGPKASEQRTLDRTRSLPERSRVREDELPLAMTAPLPSMRSPAAPSDSGEAAVHSSFPMERAKAATKSGRSFSTSISKQIGKAESAFYKN